MAKTSGAHAIARKPLSSAEEREAISVMQDEIGTRIPTPWLVGILLVCATPFLLNQFGVDFGTQGSPVDHRWAQDAPKHEIDDAQFNALAGAFSHTILDENLFTQPNVVRRDFHQLIIKKFQHFTLPARDRYAIDALVIAINLNEVILASEEQQNPKCQKNPFPSQNLQPALLSPKVQILNAVITTNDDKGVAIQA